MCLGIPLCVRSTRFDAARCDDGESGAPRWVSTVLLDEPPQPGDWLLVHVDTAIRPLSPDEAATIRDALAAAAAAAAGQPFEHLIADLINREPTPPPGWTASSPRTGSTDNGSTPVP